MLDRFRRDAIFFIGTVLVLAHTQAAEYGISPKPVQRSPEHEEARIDE
jgi:hypothetical protein